MVDAVQYPTLEQELAALDGDAARAAWLILASDGLIGTSVASIRRAMERAEFAEGVAFLVERHRAVWADRQADGTLPATFLHRIWNARWLMLDAVKGERG